MGLRAGRRAAGRGAGGGDARLRSVGGQLAKSGWSDLAAQKKFYVVYPEMPGNGCFTWWEGDAKREAQAQSIKQMVWRRTRRAVAKAEPAPLRQPDAALKAAERLARAEQGEDGGGGGMPLTHKGFLKITDMTKAEARDCERVAEIVERGGSQLLADEQLRRHRKVDKAVVRELHRLLLP